MSAPGTADLTPALRALRFNNTFVRELPADPSRDPRPRQVRGACFSRVLPTPVPAPRLLALVPEVAALLDLDEAAAEEPALTEALAGNRLLPGMEPFAACYGGHQFGHWAGQLGDGRAISLGEVVNRAGQRWELQLKGAGPTPYSRRADGRAVLRSSVRELLCSEAMFHLGVPTTRALSLVTTGELVERDMFYDGHPKLEPGAIVCRVAPSFLRFGNFEIFAARGELDVLRQLVDYTLRHHFPGIEPEAPDAIPRLVAEVSRRTARLMVEWMRVGFVHGVMNTDNLSVLGLTIDYGPYGWLDDYNPLWTPNTTDAHGRRYRYGNQPHIAHWNLARFAEALLPLTGEAEPLEEALSVYAEVFEEEQRRMLAGKIGITFRGEEDLPLLEELARLLPRVETDMTLFFRGLARVPLDDAGDASDDELLAPLLPAYYDTEALSGDVRQDTLAFLRRLQRRVAEEGATPDERRARMDRTNPKYVLRNYLAQLAIERAEAGDPEGVLELLDVMRRPYDEQPGRERFAEKRPDWARTRAGCSMLSCSS